MFRLWFLKRESEHSFISSYECVYLKAESSNRNKIRMHGGQAKSNLICRIGTKQMKVLDVKSRRGLKQVCCV